MHIRKWLPSLTGEFVEFPTHLDLFISIDIRGIIKDSLFNHISLRKYFYDKKEGERKEKSIASAKKREAERGNGEENLDRNWDFSGDFAYLLHLPLQTRTHKGAIAEEV